MADLPSDQRMSSELALSTSTSTSSTTNSSSTQTARAAASPPQAGDQSFRIFIPLDTPATSSASSQVIGLPDLRSRKEVLKSLRDSKAHAIMLQRLHDSEKDFQKEASTHKKAMRRLSKDMYQILSLYALMEGVVFTAVAQSSIFRCEDWWGSVGFAMAVTVGTFHCVLEKLRRIGYMKEQVRKFEARASAVYDQIEHLYWKGAACNTDELEPVAAGGGREDHSHCIFSGHGVVVLGFLLIFSLLIAVSCVQMLCWQPCRCNASASK